MLKSYYIADLSRKNFALHQYLQDYGAYIILCIRLVKHLCGSNGEFYNILTI